MACCETRTITVKARRDPTSYSGFRFAMYENGQEIDDHTIVCDKSNGMKKGDHQSFVFNLENAENSDLKFVGDPFDVMWVKPGNATKPPKCPESRVTDKDFNIGELTAYSTTVNNANSRQCMHKFVLNFVGTKADGSQGMVSYDPIWDNKNGGQA